MEISKIINKEKLKNILQFLRRLPWIVGEQVFLFFAIIIFFAIAAAAVFSFKYVILAQQQQPSLPELPFFERQALQGILETWQARQEIFDKADNKIYPNLFSPKK
jgi:hypothetical protein